MTTRLITIAIFYLLTITALAHNVSQALSAFDRSPTPGNANAFFAALESEEFTDEEIRFTAAVPLDSVKQQVWYWASEWFYDTQDYQPARRYGEQALKLCNGASIIKADCLNTLACICVRMSDFENAANYAKRCIDVDIINGDPDRISSSMNTLAGIYMSAHQTPEAEKIILQAIDYADRANNPPRKAVLMGMASEIYHTLAQEEKSLDYARRAYEIDSSLGRTLQAAIRQDQMATALIGLHRYAEAEKQLRNAIPVLREQEDWHSLAIADNHLGTCLIHQKRETQATPYYREAASLLARMGDKFNEMYAHRGLALCLWETAPDSARMEMDRFNEMKDSLYTSESIEAFARLNAEFGNDRLARENESISRARVRDWVLATVALLMTIAVGLVFYRRSRRRQQARIAELMSEIERLSVKPIPATDADTETPAAQQAQEDKLFLNRIIEVVNENMSKGDISLSAIASQLLISESSLRRRITAITGNSPKTYIQAIQMRRACQLLEEGKPANTVAYECGFSEPSSFTRTFKRIFGTTPSRWKDERQTMSSL